MSKMLYADIWAYAPNMIDFKILAQINQFYSKGKPILNTSHYLRLLS